MKMHWNKRFSAELKSFKKFPASHAFNTLHLSSSAAPDCCMAVRKCFILGATVLWGSSFYNIKKINIQKIYSHFI